MECQGSNQILDFRGDTAVVDPNEDLIGVITDGDLRRMLEARVKWENLTAKQIMTVNPKTIELGSHAVQALEIMQTNSITQLIVTQNGKVMGFVHLHDLLKEGII